MSKIKPGRAFAKEIFTSFDGIRAGGADEMRNFRILADGSLEKRCGTEQIYSMLDPIRGVFDGTVGDTALRILVCGRGVMSVSDGVARQITTLNTSAGKVRFFYYRSYLYLADGNDLYVYSSEDGAFVLTKGYAPLYGYNWHPTQMGEIYEPLSLFTNRVRVNYFNSTATTSFRLPFYAASVDAVFLDGVADLDFSFTSGSNTVLTSRTGAQVEVAFTAIRNIEHTARLQHTAISLSGRIDGREYVLLSAGQNGGQYVYCSANVSEEQLDGCHRFYPDSDPMYFKSDGILPVADENFPVTALYTNRSRVLAFWAKGAASIQIASKGDTVECYPLPNTMGCTVMGMDLKVDGYPIVINESGIFRLYSTANAPDEFSGDALCEGMDFWQTDAFLSGALTATDPMHGELWFRDPADDGGLVWVFCPDTKKWYCFDGIDADLFVRLDGRVGYVSGKKLYLFDEAQMTDNGLPISAVYRSGYLCFASPESVKRSLRVTLCGFGAEATLELESERKTRTFALSVPADDAPVFLDRRTRFGRFRHLRFCLRDNGTERSRWSRVGLYSNI